MTTQLLAQALAVANNPHSSADELLEVVGDLVTFGALDAADDIVERLRATNKSRPIVESLRSMIDRLRHLGPEFEEKSLSRAIAVVEDGKATDQQLLRAAESLIVWGSLDEADRALGRLRSSQTFRPQVNRLAAASHQLRRSGILQELQSLTPRKSLNKPYEVLILRRTGARRVILVFTGFARRFWLSLNALHHFLRKLDAHVIYLSDHSGRMYLNGLTSVGPGYESMLEKLRHQLRELGPHDLYVLASSAGGFVGLRAAMDLEARCFAGMSIQTTLTPSDGASLPIYSKQAIKNCRYPEMLIDLRQALESSNYPQRIQLYCGDRNIVDRSHADNLGAIRRAEINYLKNYDAHDTISGLIARGEFEQVLQRLVMDPAEDAQTRAGSP